MKTYFEPMTQSVGRLAHRAFGGLSVYKPNKQTRASTPVKSVPAEVMSFYMA